MTGLEWGRLVVVVVLGVVFAVWRFGRGGGRIAGKVKGPGGLELELQANRSPAPGISLEGVHAGRDVTATAEASGGIQAKDVSAGRDVRAAVRTDDEADR